MTQLLPKQDIASKISETPAGQKVNYPLPVYNFLVEVFPLTFDWKGKATEKSPERMSFAEVSGIAVAYDSVTYRHGLSFCEGERITTFYYDSFIPVTLKRGIIWGSRTNDLHDWLTRKTPKSLRVSLCDEQGAGLISWVIARAVPVRLEAPTFDASSNDVAIETLELQVRGVSLRPLEPKAGE